MTERDNGDPVLDSLSIDPDGVDVSTGAKTVTITATAHDTSGPGAASGISTLNTTLVPPAGSKSVFVSLQHTVGSTWVGTAKFPRYTAPGLWSMAYFQVTDKAGNYKQYNPGTFPLGAETTVPVVSVEDTTGATLTSLSLTPGSVDTRRRTKSITVTATATDDLSGVNRVQAFAKRGDFSASAYMTKVQGTQNTFRGKMEIRTWAGTGVWQLQGVQVVDNVENYHFYNYAALGFGGFKRTFSVTSRADTADPKILSFSKSAKVLDVRTRRQTLSLTVRALDKRSGIASVDVAFSSPDGVYSLGTNLKLVSGTSKLGTWKGVAIFLPCGVTPGRWKVGVYAYDKAGNQVFQQQKTIRIRAQDHTTPEVTLATTSPGVNDPVTLRFNEAVNGITTTSVVVHRAFQDLVVGGTWACKNVAGTATSCVNGQVRTALFTPIEPMAAGADYSLSVNGPGSLGVTDLAGNPFRDKYLYFHTST
ncbi:MAG TPA: Ig-like domain-containing protein [Nocardioidaceae bacterium]|nr:Ig-like domain-containing protein [Nocardioidaceae bacterium]